MVQCKQCGGKSIARCYGCGGSFCARHDPDHECGDQLRAMLDASKARIAELEKENAELSKVCCNEDD